MTDKVILPLKIKKYEASIADEIANFKDKMHEDELIERYKDDPRLGNSLEASRPKTAILSDDEYLAELSKIFSDNLNDSDSINNFLSFGGFVLKPEEAKKLKETGKSLKL